MNREGATKRMNRYMTAARRPVAVDWRRLLDFVGLIFLSWIWLQFTVYRADGSDLSSYYGADLADLYGSSVAGDRGAYLYSPAFAVLISPLTALPWPAFYSLWVGIELTLMAWLIGPALAVVAFFTLPFVNTEISFGQVHVLMAAAIVMGFRYPAAWTFVLLTKVTPAVALLWFAVRRDWSALTWVAGTTLAAITVSSLVAGHGAWVEWANLLAGSVDGEGYRPAFQVPLLIRLPVAIAVVVVAAWKDWRWLVPLGAFLALPVIWIHGPTLLLGCLALWLRRAQPTT